VLGLQVPHIGILTNGLLWVFVRYDEANEEFVKSQSYELPLALSSATGALQEALRHIVARLVSLLRDQKDTVDEMVAARSAQKQATGGVQP